MASFSEPIGTRNPNERDQALLPTRRPRPIDGAVSTRIPRPVRLELRKRQPPRYVPTIARRLITGGVSA
jgi:hypothetical protein